MLVHGAWVDGSGWKAVYDILSEDGYHVTVVQEPLTSLADDVAATERIVALQSAPLERFVSAREGPNVHQAFDALWGDYEIGDWRIISFASHPTQYRDLRVFDDYSGHNLVLDGFRVERRGLGPGNLAIYYLRYQNDTAHFATVSGRERRNAVDLHYTAKIGSWELDPEAMGQQGQIANRSILAWAFGPWTPLAYL